MPKILLKNNMISAKHLQCRLSDILPESEQKFALTDVHTRYHYDDNKNRTDAVEAIVYTVTDMNTLASFDIKVLSTVPVITAEELAESEERVFIEFPMEETIVKPYKLEYGMASVSIVAPYVQLSADSASVEALLESE